MCGIQVASWEKADHFPSQKEILLLGGWLVCFLCFNSFLRSFLVSSEVSTFIINSARFSGVLDALWVHLSSLGLMTNIRRDSPGT